MITVGSIIAAITAVFVGLPKIMSLLDQWFSKSVTEKVEDAKKDIDEELDEFAKLRPKRRD